MSEISISIILPCYNCAATVENSLNSLANQTLKNIEVIAVNDGSTDSTLEVLEKYKSNHPDFNIRIFSKKNEGIAACRNFALEKVKGEYFGFLDSDDYTSEEMFEEMLHVAKKDDAELVVSHFYWKNSRGETLQVEGPYHPHQDMMVNLFAVLWNKIYKTDFIRSLDIKFPDGNRYEDACFLYCLCSRVEKIAFVDKAYVRYVQNEKSITHTNNYEVKNMITVFQIILDYYKHHHLYDSYYDALCYIHIKFFLGNSFLRSSKIQDSKDRRETIMMGWNLLNANFPEWYKNPYLNTQKGMKNKYFKIVRRWNIMMFANLFRIFKKDNL